MKARRPKTESSGPARLAAPETRRVDDDGHVDPRDIRSKKVDQKPMTLNPWWRETKLQHRALLLMAMQDPGSNRAGAVCTGVCGGRSLELVVHALHGLAARSTVRGWFRRKQWSDRITAHDPDSQRYAVWLYRRLYMEQHGRGDMELLAPVVSVPITTHGDRPGEDTTPVQQEVARKLEKIMPPPPTRAVQNSTALAHAARRKRASQSNAALRNITLNGIQTVQQSVRAAVDPAFAEANPHIQPVVPKLHHLPMLRQLLTDLEDEEARLLGVASGTNEHSVPDTTRVTIAKELGTPILQAVSEDLREAVLMCEQLLSRPVTLEQLQVEQTLASEAGVETPAKQESTG